MRRDQTRLNILTAVPITTVARRIPEHNNTTPRPQSDWVSRIAVYSRTNFRGVRMFAESPELGGPVILMCLKRQLSTDRLCRGRANCTSRGTNPCQGDDDPTGTTMLQIRGVASSGSHAVPPQLGHLDSPFYVAHASKTATRDHGRKTPP